MFRHPSYISQFICKATGIVEGLIRLYTGDLFGIKIPIPPVAEQLEMIRFIENYGSSYDLATRRETDAIQKLREYKATLIDSAVTGKIKVPDAYFTS